MFFSTDVCVPISRLADCILETKRDLSTTSLLAPLVGHVGDGNFHLTILIDPHNSAEVSAADALNSRLIRRALEMDGTCTGEHGVGEDKKMYMPKMFNEADLDTMQRVRCAFDPKNLCNPGKVFPTPRLCGEVPGPHRTHPLVAAGIAEIF